MFYFLSVTEGDNASSSRISELGAFEQSLDFRIEDAVDLRSECC